MVVEKSLGSSFNLFAWAGWLLVNNCHTLELSLASFLLSRDKFYQAFRWLNHAFPLISPKEEDLGTKI